MSLFVSKDGNFEEFTSEVKDDLLLGDEDEVHQKVVQERQLRVQLATMSHGNGEEGQGDFGDKLDQERIAFTAGHGRDTTRNEERGHRHRSWAVGKEESVLDPNCVMCEGRRALPLDDGTGWRECLCVLKFKATRYLKPRYADVPWGEDFDIEPWNGSVLYVGPLDTFRGMAKTALVRLGMKYSHQTVQPHDIVQRLFAFYGNWKTAVFEEMKQVDILIVNFIVDPPYKDFRGTAGHILRTRAEWGRRTWIHSLSDPKTEDWQALYGSGLAEQLCDPGRYQQIGAARGALEWRWQAFVPEEKKSEGSMLAAGEGGGESEGDTVESFSPTGSSHDDVDEGNRR